MVFDDLGKSIPSQGGYEIGECIKKCVSSLNDNQTVVEVGTWLGAGTFQIAKGLIERNLRCKIYCYDFFKATESEVIKAKTRGGVDLKIGQDTLPMVKKNILWLYENIEFIKGDVRELKYKGGEIGLYIDDASKTEDKFLHVIKELEPHFSNGAFVVLMDFFMYEKRSNDKRFMIQKNYVSMNKDRYTFVKRINSELSCALFRYYRGESNG